MQEEAVDAFFAAARAGDFDRLVALLDPDVVARGLRAARVLRGAEAVARAALWGARSGRVARPALVDGAPGAVVLDDSLNMSTCCTDAGRWYVTGKTPHLLPQLDAIDQYRTSPLFSAKRIGSDGLCEVHYGPQAAAAVR